MNIFAIIVAALSSLAVGFVWYHPKVFGSAWMQATGMTEEKAQEGNMPVIFGSTLVLSCFAALFLYNFVWHPNSPEFHTFKHGAFHGMILALLVAMPTIGTNALYEQRSLRYILITVGYWVVTFAIMGGIVNIWR